MSLKTPEIPSVRRAEGIPATTDFRVLKCPIPDIRDDKRRIGIAAALASAVLLAPGAAAAAAPSQEVVMQPFFGATLEIDNLEGWHAHRFLAPDHTYRQVGSGGPASGTWVVEGGKLCTLQDKPPPPAAAAARYCNLGPGHKLGDKWADHDPVTGNAIFFTLTPGR